MFPQKSPKKYAQVYKDWMASEYVGWIRYVGTKKTYISAKEPNTFAEEPC